MGCDYAKRKSAKTKWKRLGRKKQQEAEDDKGLARERTKKRKGRRLCQGMCYKAPALSNEDKQWDAEGSDGEGAQDLLAMDDDVADRVLSGQPAAAGAELAQPKQQEQPPKKKQKTEKTEREANKTKKQQQKGEGQQQEEGKPAAAPVVRLSTGVQLLDPQLASAQAASGAAARKAAAAAGEKVVEATALKPFAPLIQSFMVSQGYLEPTPVQQECWLPACSGQDVLGVAEPGSGKTLAYLMPAAVRLQELGHAGATQPEGPIALVVTPTRELAMQVAGQCRDIRKLSGLRTVCVYGGVDKDAQIELLSKRPHIVVGTPGRLLDLVDSAALSLSHVQVIILDEADKMLSLGFKPQLDRLRGMLLPPAAAPAAASADAAGDKTDAKKKGKKGAKGKEAAAAAAPADDAAAAAGGAPRAQVLLFTATMPSEVEEAARGWLSAGAQRVQISHSAASISKTITQAVQVCAEHKKPAKLLKHLAAIKEKAVGMRNPPRVLVFANRIKTVRFLHDTLAGEGYRCVQLHGGRSQAEREAAVRDFRGGKVQVLVATDVAARGLDIRGLPYIVNYDFPPNLHTYIHRVGRTGRLAAYGHAYSFFTRNLARIASPVSDLLKSHDQAVDPNLVALAEAWKVALAQMPPEQAAKLAKDPARKGDEAEGEEEDEPDYLEMALSAPDLTEGLGGAVQEALQLLNKSKQRKKGAKGKKGEDADGDAEGAEQQQAKKKQKTAAAAGAGAGDAAGDAAGPSFKQRLAARQAEAADGFAARQQLAFIPAAKFGGAKSGYAFKTGPLGLGYYPDKAPAVSKQALKGAAGVGKGKGPIIPIGPQSTKKQGTAAAAGSAAGGKGAGKRRAAAYDSDDSGDEGPAGGDGGDSDSEGGDGFGALAAMLGRDDDDGANSGGAKAKGGAGKSAAAAGGKQQQQAGKAAGSKAAAGESAAAAGKGGKSKPLPGRLRKKLAKERAAAQQ